MVPDREGEEGFCRFVFAFFPLFFYALMKDSFDDSLYLPCDVQMPAKARTFPDSTKPLPTRARARSPRRRYDLGLSISLLSIALSILAMQS
jgi:hypothetical protein